jgi:quinol monooxygenase YgiN
VVFKYYVPPSKADDFVDNWRKMEDGARDEKHNIIFDLKKTIDDNVVFIGYGEWRDEDAFKDHLSQGYVRDFFDYLLDEDIPLRWQPLFKLTKDVDNYKRGDETGASEGLAAGLVLCVLVWYCGCCGWFCGCRSWHCVCWAWACCWNGCPWLAASPVLLVMGGAVSEVIWHVAAGLELNSWHTGGGYQLLCALSALEQQL